MNVKTYIQSKSTVDEVSYFLLFFDDDDTNPVETYLIVLESLAQIQSVGRTGQFLHLSEEFLLIPSHRIENKNS